MMKTIKPLWMGENMKKRNFILAIDQGTTGSTALIVNSKGRIVGSVNQEFPQHFPKPGWVEHDGDEIWSSVVRTIRQCLKETSVKKSEIMAIGITNQRETALAWDRLTGEILSPALVWQDRRTEERCRELKSEGLEKEFRKKTGLVIDSYFSATKMEWLRNRMSHTQRKKAVFGTIESFLLFRLTGGKSFQTDISNASRTLLMDVSKGDWDEDLLSIFSLKREDLGSICDNAGVFGETKGLSFLPDGVPICGMAGDQQSALFGQQCFEVGEAKCTFGTGSFVLAQMGTRFKLSQTGLLSTVAWRLPGGKIHYALEGGAFICGAAVQFLRDQMGFIKKSAEIEKLAKKVQDSGGVQFVPALAGLGAPHWRSHARGVITGLTRATSRSHIAYATLEAMALQNADILFAMSNDLEGPLKVVRVDGGAAQNNMLMQMQANILGIPVLRPRYIETTGLGAAFLASLGSGLVESVGELKSIWHLERRFENQWSSVKRNKRRAEWLKALAKA